MMLALLKWLGIFLLVLLLAAFFLLCIVLFVPVRYHVQAVFGEEFRVSGYGSFFLHLIYISFRVEGGEENHVIRILGIPLGRRAGTSGKAESRKRPGKKRTASKKRKMDEAELESEGEGTEQTLKSDRQDIPEQRQGEVKLTEWIEDGARRKEGRRKEGRPTDAAQKSDEQPESGPVDQSKPDEQPESDPAEQPESEAQREEGNPASEKSGFLHKFFGRIERFLLSIRARFVRIYRRLRRGFFAAEERAGDIQGRASVIRKILQDENTPRLWSLVWQSVWFLLRHSRPRRVRGRIVFGAGDPCTTGQILGVIGMCYAAVGSGVEITPDFERSVLDGKLGVWGRAQIGVVLYLVVRILCSGEWKHFKEQAALW